MKKLLASISVVFYFIVSCGVVINLHYCMGSFQSFELYSVKSDKCGKCGMHMNENNGCCHDEVKIIKLQDDQNKVTVSSPLRGIEPSPVISSGFIFDLLFNNNESVHYNTHSPPLLTGQDTYLQNCVFRI